MTISGRCLACDRTESTETERGYQSRIGNTNWSQLSSLNNFCGEHHLFGSSPVAFITTAAAAELIGTKPRNVAQEALKTTSHPFLPELVCVLDQRRSGAKMVGKPKRPKLPRAPAGLSLPYGWAAMLSRIIRF